VLKKSGFILGEGSEAGGGSGGGSVGGMSVGDWCPNKEIYLCQANGKPDIKTNPPQVGAIWIDTQDLDIYICVDNTTDKNVWRSIKGNVVKPLETPTLTLENISSPQMVELPEEINNGFTLVFYGEGWQSGNYHYFFHSYDANGNWLNDAYYGNGFTVRKNCGFSYQYLSTPPYGEKLVAVFRFAPDGYLVRFYRVSSSVAIAIPSLTNAYEKAGSNIVSCPHMKKVCLYANDCSGKNPLGGTIYKFELYNIPLPDEEIDAIAQRIVENTQV
jgi:hypothetical protein